MASNASDPPDAASARGSGSDAPTAIKTHPIQHGHRPTVAEQIPASLVPANGWHFVHLFYRVNRARLALLSPEDVQRGREDFARVLRANTPGAPEQFQCFAVPGHKADFGIVMAGPDLRAIHDVQMAIQASSLGPALDATYSFYSITEISEYVPDAEAYAKILREREGLDPASPMFKAKAAAYTERLEPMNRRAFILNFPNGPVYAFTP